MTRKMNFFSSKTINGNQAFAYIDGSQLIKILLMIGENNYSAFIDF